jgi:hypothetical protein
MKTKNIFSKVTGLVIALTFFFGTAYANSGNGDKLKSVQDSIESGFEKAYGSDIKLDATLKSGCYNYLKEFQTGTDQGFVQNQGHVSTVLNASDRTGNVIKGVNLIETYGYEFFVERALNTLNTDEFKSYFSRYGSPKKFWVEQIESNGVYYVVISFD